MPRCQQLPGLLVLLSVTMLMMACSGEQAVAGQSLATQVRPVPSNDSLTVMDSTALAQYALQAQRLAAAQAALANDSLATARDTLTALVASDDELRWLHAIELLEAHYREVGQFDQARDVLAQAQARLAALAARFPTDSTRLPVLHRILEEWWWHHDVARVTGSAPKPLIFGGLSMQAGGMDSLLTHLALPDTQAAPVFVGDVRVAARVTEQGAVDAAYITVSSGHYAYDQAALDVLTHARFTPARRRDVIFATWVILTIPFSPR